MLLQKCQSEGRKGGEGLREDMGRKGEGARLSCRDPSFSPTFVVWFFPLFNGLCDYIQQLVNMQTVDIQNTILYIIFKFSSKIMTHFNFETNSTIL